MPAEAIKTGAGRSTLGIDDIYSAIEKRVISVSRPTSRGSPLMPAPGRSDSARAPHGAKSFFFAWPASSSDFLSFVQEVRSVDSLVARPQKLSAPGLRKVRHVVQRGDTSFSSSTAPCISACPPTPARSLRPARDAPLLCWSTASTK